MLSEEDAAMDYDELTLNPLLAEIEAETTEVDGKREKQRRYWTAKEEQKFFEIWGRDNWRLTRHGKNTIFFAQWAAELKERFKIEVKPEEIQAKVNQTRAKFRQVKKQIATDKNCTIWKKFNVIDKILKNQYRPKDAEPIPQEALERNRDIDLNEVASPPTPPSPSRSARPSSPTSITSSSNTQEVAGNGTAAAAELNGSALSGDVTGTTADIEIKLENDYMPDSSMNTSLYNSSSELFNEPLAEVKDEFPSEYPNFSNYPRANQYDAQQTTQQLGDDDEDGEPQLHTLQTPQQLLEQQQQLQQQQQQYQQYPAATTTTGQPQPADTTSAAMANGQAQNEQMMQQQQYGNSYAAQTNQVVPNQNHYAAPQEQQQQNAIRAYNNQYEGAAAAAAPTTAATATTAAPSTTTTTTATATTMHPPGHGRGGPGQPRRRRTATSNSLLVAAQAAGAASAGGTDSLETIYLNEVRKKNILLAEQMEISRKRMLLEERKVNLLERFFPKCLEMQEQILGKLNSGGNGGGGASGNT